MHYRVLSRISGKMEGTGTSLNMSSSGILFTADQALPVGSRIEVAISWPTPADATLRLVALGRIVRSDERTAAMKITRHEFRG